MVFCRMRWNSRGSSAARVFVGQLQHGVLDDIQRDMLVAHRKHGLLECPPLDFREEVGQFLLGSQKCPSSLCGESPADAQPADAGKRRIRPNSLVLPATCRIRLYRATQTGLWRPCQHG
jgi:hypothetical protein